MPARCVCSGAGHNSLVDPAESVEMTSAGDTQHKSNDGPMCTVGFAFGFLLGLPLGILLWLPETIFTAGILVDVLHVSNKTPTGVIYLGIFTLYLIWLLLVLAPLPVLLVKKLIGKLSREEKRARFGFFRGLLCSLPLATIYINFLWTSGHH
jgi:hypothetical protein